MIDSPEQRSRSVFAEGRLVGKLRRGDVAGALPLITGEPRSATVRTAVPTTALELREDEFRDLIARFPPILENLSRLLSDRLVEATRRQATRGRARRGGGAGGGAGAGRRGARAAGRSACREPRLGGGARRRPARSRRRSRGSTTRCSSTARWCSRAELDTSTLPVLLEQVDRAVVLLTEEDAQLRPPPGDGVELVLAGPGGWRGGGDVVRRVERRGAGLAAGDVAWLGRHLARTKLGLALGAGGAKGYAHVGRARRCSRRPATRSTAWAAAASARSSGTWVALGMGAAEIEATMRETLHARGRVAEIFKISLRGPVDRARR